MATTTENYGLKQWEESDPVSVGEINENFAAVDAALAAMPQLRFGSYVGKGTCGSSNKNSITFEFVPKVIVIFDYQNTGMAVIMNYGTNPKTYPGFYYRYSSFSFGWNQMTWSGKTLSWFNTSYGNQTGSNSTANAVAQMNESGTTYYYFYF